MLLNNIFPANYIIVDTRPLYDLTMTSIIIRAGKDVEGRLYNNTALMNASISTVQSVSPTSRF